MLFSSALAVAKKRGTGVSLGKKWWLGFLKRNVEFARLALNICHFNNSFVLSKKDFGKVFRKAYEKCVEELHMQKAFKACGIVSLDSHAISSQRVMPAAMVVLPEDTTTTTCGPDTVVCEAGPSPLPARLSAQVAAPPAPPLHPLVASGDLADLLHPISYKKQKTTSARVITENGFYSILMEKNA
ncbi:hypothetical protein SKAU_G00387570 [Synaphobranchus kaupii]|uniref:HTH CENPB-type domain-containing protein n=1 Tax=Synaphobranchus kaupii TaxID=118154 RepID=A0A9Q1ICG4_SYNKA|nr:hypothetical protein SKAU_G00387570 [Synaphobranchus kaupii]